MDNTLTAETSVIIHVPVAKVWKALVTPELIKQYLFGTEAISDWKVGSTITYQGTWEGKPYADKGVIKQLEPEKILQSTYWSGMSGTADVPENYALVTYTLTEEKDGTRLSITQDNNKTDEGRKHAEQNWQTVLGSLKKLLETK